MSSRNDLECPLQSIGSSLLESSLLTRKRWTFGSHHFSGQEQQTKSLQGQRTPRLAANDGQGLALALHPSQAIPQRLAALLGHRPTADKVAASVEDTRMPVTAVAAGATAAEVTAQTVAVAARLPGIPRSHHLVAHQVVQDQSARHARSRAAPEFLLVKEEVPPGLFRGHARHHQDRHPEVHLSDSLRHQSQSLQLRSLESPTLYNKDTKLIQKVFPEAKERTSRHMSLVQRDFVTPSSRLSP